MGYFPFSTKQLNGMSGDEVKIKSIEINPEINPEMFKFKETATETVPATEKK